MSTPKESLPKESVHPCIVVEGNIGAGKSTFLTMLKKHLQVHLVYEPHTKWQDIDGENLLEYFYKDAQRWGYTFQSYAFVTRVLEQEKAWKENNSQIKVLERSVYSDRYCFAENCFELGLMNTLEWKLYQEWFTWLVDKYTTPPSAFIYLRTDPAICHERLLKRNRSEEAQVSLDYLTRVHDKHESWLIKQKDIPQTLKNIPVLVLECNKEFEQDESEQLKHIEKIILFCEKTFYIPPNEFAVAGINL